VTTSLALSFFFPLFGVLMPKGEKNLSMSILCRLVHRFYLDLACKTIF
jgi:hypothetical protein